jgi:hypothetical protein
VAWYISPLSLSVGDACQRSGGFGVVDPCVRFGASVTRGGRFEWLMGYFFLIDIPIRLSITSIVVF